MSAPSPDQGGGALRRRLNPASRTVLSTFLRHAREQGLARYGIEPAGLFARETHDELAI